MKQTIIAVAAALAATGGWAGESAEFRLDTMDGTRTARAVETIAYSTAWNGGGMATVAVDGVSIKEANAPASGDVVWNAAQATPGTHTLTHTADVGRRIGELVERVNHAAMHGCGHERQNPYVHAPVL